MGRSLFLVCLFLAATAGLRSQGAPLPVNEEGYDLVRRLYLRYGFTGFTPPAADLELRPAGRGDLVRLVKTYRNRYGSGFSRVDDYRVSRFLADNNEWLSLPPLGEDTDADRAPFWIGEDFPLASERLVDYPTSRNPLFGTFYTTPSFLLEYNRDDFYLRLNPLFEGKYGRLAGDSQDYLLNRRGLRLRAGLDDRLFLHFEMMLSQFGPPNYVRNYFREVGSLPGAGLVKDDLTFDFAGIERGLDYLNGAGYLSVDITRHVGARLGYGQHFIGSGERSVLLSDFSNNYPYLELNWRIWKFHYRNIFAELTAGPQDVTNTGLTLPKKYMAAHYLSILIGRRLNLGLFEAVIFSRDEGFELAYLNPIVLYRTVEGSVGSPDNVLIGLTAAYQLPFRTEVYGQFMLDEFVFNELFVEQRGWWANKWAYQAGIRHVDALGIGQLDLVAERNSARPFMYSHGGPSSYTHFALPLAHPLGANFTENLAGFDYRPLPRLHLSGRLFLIEQGEGRIDSVAVGENPEQSSSERENNFGNSIGQGVNYTTTLYQFTAGYELRPNLWIEGTYLGRAKDSELDDRDQQTTLVRAGIHWNIAPRRDWY